MISNISLVTVYCLEQDKARDFYVNILGFEVRMRDNTGNWLVLVEPREFTAADFS